MLGKFSDLPQEAEEEIRSFDEARQRIAELERQTKGLKGAKPASQTDQTAVARAVKAAMERERAGWRRKLEQGRARFRKMVAVAASAGESLAQLKESLEEAEREW